ncbi:hypothetical protein BKA81DRAFT_113351 [Phyllosticta paracitricarpa]
MVRRQEGEGVERVGDCSLWDARRSSGENKATRRSRVAFAFSLTPTISVHQRAPYHVKSRPSKQTHPSMPLDSSSPASCLPETSLPFPRIRTHFLGLGYDWSPGFAVNYCLS